MKKPLVLLFLLLLTSPLLAQEHIIKAFAEPRRPSKWLNPICFYPSTLRMINLSQNPEFNAMVNDIEKVLIYTLDSATVATGDYTGWLAEYEAIGYEEYLRLTAKQKIRIIGKDDEFVGILANDENVFAFYLRGEIPFGKIPRLLETFRSTDVLPIIADRFK